MLLDIAELLPNYKYFCHVSRPIEEEKYIEKKHEKKKKKKKKRFYLMTSMVTRVKSNGKFKNLIKLF